MLLSNLLYEKFRGRRTKKLRLGAGSWEWINLSDKNLFSITYSRIWNETYLSYRNFENYIFFNTQCL